jgi:uncharacterized membrane protein (DUF373 family)
MANILRMSNLAEKIHREEDTFAVREPPSDQAVPDAWAFFSDSVYPALVRTLIGLLIVTLCLWMLAGVARTLWGLWDLLIAGWTAVAEHTIINALILLALLEVIRTLQSYLKLGRVRVTFILDTALVVLISELMGLWFREYAPEKVLLGLGVIVTLVALRIVTAKFSPEPSH